LGHEHDTRYHPADAPTGLGSLAVHTARPIYKLIKSGELPASKIGGRLLIEASDVEALIEHARQRASEPRPGGLLGLERGR
jgi:excisionase family DNA binding protein